MDLKNRYKKYKHSEDTLKTAATIDDEKIIAEHWWLKPSDVAYSCPVNVMGGGDFPSIDFQSVNRDLIVVGTRRQSFLFFCMMLKLDGWQLKDSWDYQMEQHLIKLYEKNDSEVLCMELRFAS